VGPTRDQVFHDRNRLDHGGIAIDDRRNEAAGIDGEKLRIVLGAGQQIDRAEPVRQAHLLHQPDDPEAPALAIDGDHGAQSFNRGNAWSISGAGSMSTSSSCDQRRTAIGLAFKATGGWCKCARRKHLIVEVALADPLPPAIRIFGDSHSVHSLSLLRERCRNRNGIVRFVRKKIRRGGPCPIGDVAEAGHGRVRGGRPGMTAVLHRIAVALRRTTPARTFRCLPSGSCFAHGRHYKADSVNGNKTGANYF
jgi:hypothetical protein